MSLPVTNAVPSFTLPFLPSWGDAAPRSERQKPVSALQEPTDSAQSDSPATYLRAAEATIHSPKIARPFFDALDQARRSQHLEARQSPFLKQLINADKQGFCTKEYLNYLHNLFALHCIIEKAQQIISEKYGSNSFNFPLLWRSKEIEKDIETWKGIYDPGALDLHEATKEYVAHLKDLISKEQPLPIMGAIYALYGSILSSGQTNRDSIGAFYLRRREQSPAPTYADDNAVRIFTLPEEVSDVQDFKERWHHGIEKAFDQLPLSEQEKAALTEAAAKEVLGAMSTVVAMVKKP